MKLPITGGCLCGSIRYECSSEPLGTGNCHCRDCQKARGSAFSPVFAIPATALKVTKGAVKIYASKADDGDTVRRAFCPECGSPIYAFNDPTKEYVGVLAMSLDDPSWFQPTIDTWTASAQPWVSLSTDTKKFTHDFIT